jgi:hypothetical protein
MQITTTSDNINLREVKVSIVTDDGSITSRPELCFTLPSEESFTINYSQLENIILMYDAAFKEYRVLLSCFN